MWNAQPSPIRKENDKIMESPNAEYRGFDPTTAATMTPTRSELEQLSDQYKSMRELLKIYGLNVAEGLIPDHVDKQSGDQEKGKRNTHLLIINTFRLCKT